MIKLGDFHTVMSFCSAIGKIFKDAGLLMLFDSLSTSYSTLGIKNYKWPTLKYFLHFLFPPGDTSCLFLNFKA